MKRIISVLMCSVFLSLFFTPAVFSYSPDERAERNKLLASLYEADVGDIRDAILEGLISCEDVTRYYIRRIERYNKEFNCFISLFDDALQKAKEKDEMLKNGDASGLLFGVPVVIKDNIKLKGTYTTNGHYFSASKKAKNDAQVTARLLEEGAVIIGKTNMSTDAQDARTSLSLVAGETKNAYNSRLTAGGSSGGTAVAVSLNFCAAGLGTDTNSSLRYPAALSGTVALRSTFGLVSTKGIIALNSTRDVAGAITRTVKSQALMLDVLTDEEYGFYDALDSDFLSDGIRLGILRELSGPVKNIYSSDAAARFDIGYRTKKYIDSEVTDAFLAAVKELEELGAEVREVSMPRIFSLSEKAFETNASSRKTALYQAFRKFMEENSLDAVIFPTYLSAPMKSAAAGNIYSAVFINNCRVLSPSAGLPELTVPIGQHSSGAGIGMEIASLKNSEQLLLNIGYSYEQAASMRKAPDTAPDFYSRYFVSSLNELLDPGIISVPVISPEEESTFSYEEVTSENTEDDKDSSGSVIAPYIVVGVSLIVILGIGFTFGKKYKENIKE